MPIFDNLPEFFEKVIGFIQETGIVFMLLIALIGLMLYLLAGNNPIMKRGGLVVSIVFGVGTLAAAYLPVSMYYFLSDERRAKYFLEVVADDSVSTIEHIFVSLFKIALPIAITAILIGLMIRGLGALNPKTKRKGIGIIITSSLVLLAIFVTPKLVIFL